MYKKNRFNTQKTISYPKGKYNRIRIRKQVKRFGLLRFFCL